MSNKTEVQQIFDTVLDLKYGEAIELSFPLEVAAESFRSALYRERKNWMTKTKSKEQISITRDYLGFPFKLEITKIPGLMSAVIKKTDGVVKELVLKEEEMEMEEITTPPPTALTAITEIERQKELMRADNIPEEEIEAYFKEDLE